MAISRDLKHATASQEPPTPGIGRDRTILIVEDDADLRRFIAIILRRAGYRILHANNGHEALARIAETPPDAILSDVMMPEMDGFQLLAQLRETSATRDIPVILITAKGETRDVITGLTLGTVDYLVKPIEIPDLLARTAALFSRADAPIRLLEPAKRTGIVPEGTFWAAVQQEGLRAAKTNRSGSLAYLALAELTQLRDRLGTRIEREVAHQIAAIIYADAGPLDLVGNSSAGLMPILLPEADATATDQRLRALTTRIVEHHFIVGGERLRLAPSIGYTALDPARTVAALREQALLALDAAAAHLDLLPVAYNEANHGTHALRRDPTWWDRTWALLRLPVQALLVNLVYIVVPFCLYLLSGYLGLDLAAPIYIMVVIALVMTAFFIWVEGLLALRPIPIPDAPSTPEPPASAIIAAYLPNEAATVTETIEAFLRLDYPAPLQIILAYNTPRDMPIEGSLRELARHNPHFLPLRVAGSTSKAQNVNAALAHVTGAFVAVFDADHHPAPDSFRRAWRWLSNGWDIVQGHCVIRNGDESWVARLVAVEFEGIYAASHPGRTRLHGFGIFGGANGYWRTDWLRRIRMHGAMLTEDIDSSLRAIEAGARIATDPQLLSRELAPVLLQALTNQRLRWAQGWFQVSLKHIRLGLTSQHLTWRQKLGFLHLLLWREVYPIFSVQILPIVGYWVVRYGGLHRIDWFVPIFVLTTIFTLSTGPGQALFAYRTATPEIKRHRWWFLYYFVVASIFYTGYKNLIAVVAQVKEFMRERQWKVTPRAGTSASDES